MYPSLEHLFSSEEENIYRLFTGNHYFRMKDNQRHFAWEENEVEQFWLDFLNVYKKNTFVDNAGSLNLVPDPKQYFFGILVFSEVGNFYEVIDGQQRLTSTSVFLQLLWDISKRITDSTKLSFLYNSFQQMVMPQVFPDPQGKQRIFPDPAVATLYKDYILANDAARETYKKTKMSRIKADTAEHRLLFAYNYLKGELDKEFPISMSQDELYKKLSYFLYTIAYLFTILKITVREEGTAYTIFETVNNRGKDLSKSDLIKNTLFASITNQSQRALINDCWNRIVTNTNSEDLTDYIRFHYLSKYAPVRPMQLHEEIKKHISSNDPFQYLKELETESEWYGAITLQNTGFWSSGEITKKLQEFKKIDVTACIPLLLTGSALYHNSEADFKNLVNATLVFAFRFFTTGDNSVEKLEREIGLMARALRKAEDLSNKTAKEIQEIEDKEPHRKIKDLSSLINYMKSKTNDALFKANFSKFRTSSSTLAGYILTELQLPKLSAGISITHGMDLQVEHIMPKTPSGRRINEWQHVRNEPEFKHFLTRLGNLMILEGDLNRACNNKIFQTKLDKYKNSQLTIPKQLHNDYTTGTWFSKTPIEREKAWNFKTIETRQLKMADEALNIWKY
ncbi:DUF262 domain-containing protein [Lysinibacillus fusiformis]|uniref:DUF262 domain-containing protein n=1 Tax=Lysinibacillus fusiformis TaxID=28031 RepID=UPI001880BE84|nr:DUF262 domain-containing protein [Lysinibacillus fusiformis]MBD8522740.1 DUF262 domain-containing protein [Lysinibacillus fusiformis]